MKTLSIAFMLLLVASTYITNINSNSLKRWDEQEYEAYKKSLEENRIIEEFDNSNKLEELKKDKLFALVNFFSVLFTYDEATIVALEAEKIAKAKHEEGRDSEYNEEIPKMIGIASKEEIMDKLFELLKEYQIYELFGYYLPEFFRNIESKEQKFKVVNQTLRTLPLQDIQNVSIKMIDFFLSLTLEEDHLSKKLIDIICEIKTDIKGLTTYEDLEQYVSTKFFTMIDIIKDNSPTSDRYVEKIKRMTSTFYTYGIQLLKTCFYGNFSSNEELNYYMMNVTEEEAKEFAFKMYKVNYIYDNRSKYSFFDIIILSLEEEKEVNQIVTKNLQKLSRRQLAELVAKLSKENPFYTSISFVRNLEITTK